MAKELQSFLKDFRNEGSLDSSGVFTLHSERAQLQLSALHSAQPGVWLLRILQAAVASRASRIQLWEKMGSVRVQCCGYHPDRLSVGALLACLRDPLASGQAGHEASHYVVLALRAAASLQPTLLEVGLNGLRLSLHGQELRLEEGSVAANLELNFVPGRKSGWFFRGLQQLIGISAERRALTERACYLPISVISGKERLNLEPAQQSLARSWLGQVRPSNPEYLALELLILGRDSFRQDVLSMDAACPLAQTYRTGWGPRTCRVLIQQRITLDSRTLKLMGHTSDQRGSNPSLLARLRLPLRLQGPTRLIVVRHGIQCNVCEVEIGWPGLEIVMTAPRLKLDLSQLSVVVSADLWRILDNLKPLLEKALRSGKDDLLRLPAGYQAELQRTFPWLRLKPTVPPAVSTTAAHCPAVQAKPQDQPAPPQPRLSQRRPFRR